MIRRMTPQDAEQVVPMLEQFTNLTAVAGPLGFDPAGASVFLSLLDGPLLVGFVAEEGGEVSGLILGSTTPYPWNPSRLVVQEMAWWVRPEKRGGGTAAKLLKALENEAAARGASVILMLCEHGIKHESVARLYQRRGYSPLEHIHMKEL